MRHKRLLSLIHHSTNLSIAGQETSKKHSIDMCKREQCGFITGLFRLDGGFVDGWIIFNVSIFLFQFRTSKTKYDLYSDFARKISYAKNIPLE